MSSASRHPTSPDLSSDPSPDVLPVPPVTRIKTLKRYWRLPLPTGKPLAVFMTAVILLLLPVCLLEAPVLRHTHGNFLFPLDNAFVDISVGRTLAFYQVWGLSKYAFQSAATSLLYPVVLALIFFIAGAHLLIPLVVNFLAAAWFLLALQRSLIRHGLSPLQQLIALLAAMVGTLLPLLVVSGMEYTLQLLFVFLFMESLVEALEWPAVTPTANGPGAFTSPGSSQSPGLIPSLGVPRRVYLYGLLAVAARYEDLIIIALACILLGIQRGWKPALRLLLVSVSPVAVFGIISIVKHSYFLPNALLLGPYPVYALALAACAVAAACVLIIRYARFTLPQRTTILPRLALGLLALLILPFTARNIGELGHFQRDCLRIYDEQYPMAGFVHLYYYKKTVGVNLPGAVSYFSEGRKLDFTGVASSDITRSKREHFWSPVYADSLGRKDGIRVAIVADPWFPPDQLPHNWEKIASWNIPDKTDGAGRTVNFYVLQTWDTTWLRRDLHEYQHLLPAGVAVRYYP